MPRAPRPRSSSAKPWLDHRRDAAERAAALVAAMTREEKIAQLLNEAPAIPRLGVTPYNWWNECLHGVGRAGRATVFPQPIGLAATFDAPLVHRVATAISDEARAKHRIFSSRQRYGIYMGLTFWTPNINIFRDPRWGRGHETYGECPHLTGTMGVAFITGLQGNDPRHLKLVATAKHWVVHSGPESQRHTFDARVDRRDQELTYFPAFRMAVQQARVASVMGAYNRTNGEPCCGSPTLDAVLRMQWGFDGYVVSDCGAINDFHKFHKIDADPAAAAARALINGCDLECGFGDDAPFRHLATAIARGLCSDADLDRACVRVFTARFRLGLFDDPKRVRWARTDPAVIDSPRHRALARRAAQASIVLLKNEGGLLPLAKDLASVVLVGPNADACDVLLGNYNGLNPRLVTVVEGITAAVSPETNVQFFRGADLLHPAETGFGAAVWTAEQADAVVAVMGLSPRIEGEEGEACLSDAAGDRNAIELPAIQIELLKRIKAKGKKLIVVLMNGGAVACPWIAEHADAVLTCWYPGEEGGTAVADVLFGDVNPAGRLPITFYRATTDLPPFGDYRMAPALASADQPATPGRTYRYFAGPVQWPFGHGLSYTTFRYAKAKALRRTGFVELSVEVANAGPRDGEEVVQAYLSDDAASVPVPRRSLVGYVRIAVKRRQRRRVTLRVPLEAFAIVNDDGTRTLESGSFTLWLGGGQPGSGAPGAALSITL